MRVNDKDNKARCVIKINRYNTDFYSFIEEMRELHRDENGYKITKKRLSEVTQIPYEMLKKVISKSRKTTNRDYIIAICIGLNMNIFETNKALELYQMHKLNDNNIRDSIISSMIIKGKSIEEVNKELKNLKCTCLNIGHRKLDNIEGIKKEKIRDMDFCNERKRYRILEQEIYIYDFFEFINENTLSSMYNPEKFTCTGVIIYEDKDTKKKYKIEIEGTYRKYEILNDGSELLKEKFTDKNEIEDDELLGLIVNVECLINSKTIELKYMANDTKNYMKRASAHINDIKCYIFEERFNYELPELNEYYLLESINGEICLSVWDKSVFMTKYLDKEKYMKIYGKNEAKCICSFKGIAELKESQNDVENEISNYNILNKYVFESRMKHFKEMIEDLERLKLDLKKGELVVYNSSELECEDILKFYNAKELFNCVEDEQGNFIPQSIEYIDKNGNVIRIEDLYRAVELGIESIEKISSILNKKDKLESIII